jgi:hypothetical protein
MAQHARLPLLLPAVSFLATLRSHARVARQIMIGVHETQSTITIDSRGRNDTRNAPRYSPARSDCCQPTVTSMPRGLASSALGMRNLNTPSLRFASIFVESSERWIRPRALTHLCEGPPLVKLQGRAMRRLFLAREQRAQRVAATCLYHSVMDGTLPSSSVMHPDHSGLCRMSGPRRDFPGIRPCRSASSIAAIIVENRRELLRARLPP